MYDKKAWWGKEDPHITVTFDKGAHSDGDPLASLVIFEWRDHHMIGRWKPGSNHEHEVRARKSLFVPDIEDNTNCHGFDISMTTKKPSATRRTLQLAYATSLI